MIQEIFFQICFILCSFDTEGFLLKSWNRNVRLIVMINLTHFLPEKMERTCIPGAQSICLFMLNRLIPMMTIKSEFLAPASRSEVPRASIGGKSRKNAIFLNRRGELLIYFTWNWLHVAEKNDSGGRKCLPAYSWADLVEKMYFFKPEVGKCAICDVKFAKTAKIWLKWDQWLNWDQLTDRQSLL